jgi:hypothetical protein
VGGDHIGESAIYLSLPHRYGTSCLLVLACMPMQHKSTCSHAEDMQFELEIGL